MTLHVRMSAAIDAVWSRVEPVRVGNVTPTLGTPPLFVTVTDEDEPLLRVDVYSIGAEYFASQDAIVWRETLIVGYGGHVHAVSLGDRSTVCIPTEPYFGSLHPTQDYLLIASGERLLRLEPDRSILWTSETLGLDGVVVQDPGPTVVRGEGEWDPPGGWRPFALLAADGRRVAVR